MSIFIRMILATWQNVTDKVWDQLSGTTHFFVIYILLYLVTTFCFLNLHPGYLVSQCCKWEKRSTQTVTSSRLKMAPSSCWEAAGLVSWIPGPKRWSTLSPQTQWSRTSPFSLYPSYEVYMGRNTVHIWSGASLIVVELTGSVYSVDVLF
jgi:hypothetical protein